MPPAEQPPPVEIRQEEFVSALTDLVLHLHLRVEAPGWEGRIRLASWDAGSRDTASRIPVWEGAAVPISEYLDPLAFKIMLFYP